MKQCTRIFLIACACVFVGITLSSCKAKHKLVSVAQPLPAFMKIGHRGTRGLMPENTIVSMTKAIETGANTIEVDVHVTKDGKIIVYHDESFNPEYTLMPDGTEIPKTEREKYRFYQMNYDEIKPFIIGSKEYPAYPKQQRIATYTPLLSELIDSVEAYTASGNLPRVYFLVEVKSKEKTDGIEQPAPEEFMEKLMQVLGPKNLGHRLIIQSFDMRPLQVLHRKYPAIALGFLTDDRKATMEENLARLGFTPAFYNPHFSLVTEEMVKKCHAKKIRVTPWTVNNTSEMVKQKAMQVDGIITDYPNLFAEL
jgi:glycerophosphoryl diester phosphodiesterase